MVHADAAPMPRARLRLDKLGVLIALVIAGAWLFLPFAVFRANRIVPGEGVPVFNALPPLQSVSLGAAVLLGLPLAAFRFASPWLRVGFGYFALIVLFGALGASATLLTPEGNSYARVSPGSGFWVLLFAFTLLVADALTRLQLKPWPRISLLASAAAAFAIILTSGILNDLSILREYANRADAFWREGQVHVLLAFGSVVIAMAAGVPLGIVCARNKGLRAVVLNVLNIVQTIPSIALFGLLIAPLAWVAASVPGAAALGIAGIVHAPAMVALFAYSLLPIVANTVVGLLGVPEAANDAARGMGMTDRQRLFGVELPLAFPVILTGVRVVLVQNIGLATIAALIGGGGFGVFVFQGIGQTAMDLVLLGAVPTVVLAFAAAIILDAAVEMASTPERAHD